MSDQVEKIFQLAKTSKAAKYHWKDRGSAPVAYLAGMAITYVAAVGRLAAGDPYAAAMAGALDPDGKRDTLSWYADILDGAGLSRDTASDRLLALFVVMMGLGMRESSGQHCEGRDMAADNVDALTAEAGLFQVSYNSVTLHPLLTPLFDKSKGREDLLPVFSRGVTCKPASWQDWGEGKGKDFQTLMKRNPEFSIIYTGILMRCARRHWGPLNTKKAEVRPEIATLLRDALEIGAQT